jgi:raffinose/stachyose/melibiose transport system permease protein
MRRLIGSVILAVISLLYVSPLFIIFLNSFKGKIYINEVPFQLPTEKTWAGLANYMSGIEDYGLLKSVGWTLMITIGSVAAILLFCSMFAWFITRVSATYTKILYTLCVFSMVVPFQMVMFTMSKFANTLGLDNPVGIIFIYTGFGAGLSTFMFSGFVKSIPIDIEEAAMIDGCGPIRTFFAIVFPVLQPTAVTVAILNTMWIWNDYLLPSLLLQSEHRTIPIAVQYLKGGYGSIDMGAMMAMLVMAIIPIVVFYLSCQKYIIKGVAAGAVKG